VASFLGRYDYQLDPKGRLSLPADFRRVAEGSAFVLLQWESTHLTLFPESVWDQVQERILGLRRSKPALQNRLRRITARAVRVEPDKQGRILVPANLKEAVGLDGAVVVAGNVDRIEIWDPATFARTVDVIVEDGEHDEELVELDVQIFG
jgi:MraZ protein